MMLKIKTSQGAWRILDNLVDVQWHATKPLPETSDTSSYTWKSETPENSSQGQKIYKLYRGNNFQAEFALYVYGQQYRTILKRNLIRDSDNLEQELAHLKAPVHHMSTRDLRGELVQQAKILCEEALSSYLERKGLLPSEDVPDLQAVLTHTSSSSRSYKGTITKEFVYKLESPDKQYWLEFTLKEVHHSNLTQFGLDWGGRSSPLTAGSKEDATKRLAQALKLASQSYNTYTYRTHAVEEKRQEILYQMCRILEPILLAEPEESLWSDWGLEEVGQRGQNKSDIRIQDTTYRHSSPEHWIEFELREDTQNGNTRFTLFPGKFSDSLNVIDINTVFEKLQPLCNQSYDLATFYGTDMSLEKKRDAILDVICKELEEMADSKSPSNEPEITASGSTDYDIQEITGAGNRYEITAKQGGRDLAILFDTEGYLLNDQGQTIESMR